MAVFKIVAMSVLAAIVFGIVHDQITWWVGLPLGVGLAIAARAGRRPKLNMGSLIQPLARLCLIMFCIAAIAGAIGFFTSKAGIFQLVGRLASEVPKDRHIAFLTCGWAHSASYLSAVFGGACLWIFTWRRRGRLLPPI
jgi:hypothetical protein